MKKVIIISIFLLPCCYTHSLRHVASPAISDKKIPELLKITSEESVFSSQFMGHIFVNFDNKSPKWIEIKDVNITFGKENDKKVQLILGEKLKWWSQAANAKRAITVANYQNLYATIAGLGALSSSLSSSSSDKIGFQSVSLSGVASMLSSSNEKNLVNYIPDNHLLRNFSIPPGLFSTKWIVFQAFPSTPKLSSFTMTLKVDEEVKSYKLKFRAFDSKWQIKPQNFN